MSASRKQAKASPVEEMPVLVLQGGGALGSYQAGVYEELMGEGVTPRWIAGISIGAINGALIAGNPPERRVQALREFWRQVSSWQPGTVGWGTETSRLVASEASAVMAATFGAPGFFLPRVPPAWMQPPGTPGAMSVYDTAPLARTLGELIDFDLLNDGSTRLSVGAVHVQSGNFSYFDTRRQRLGPEHIMARGALPPGFPPVAIDGQLYWDGGIVSNTPLQYVLDEEPRPELCVFQVDLFSARGEVPRTVIEALEREKDIRYSSRTRLNTDAFKRLQTARGAVHRLLAKLPEELQEDEDVRLLRSLASSSGVTIVHLINKRRAHHTQSKDYEFSRQTIEEHWSAGRADVRRTLAHPSWTGRSRPSGGVVVLDLS